MIDKILGLLFIALICTIVISAATIFQSCSTLCIDDNGNRVECKPPHYEKY